MDIEVGCLRSGTKGGRRAISIYAKWKTNLFGLGPRECRERFRAVTGEGSVQEGESKSGDAFSVLI